MSETTHAAATTAALFAHPSSFSFPASGATGRRARGESQHGRLTRRQFEILQLVAHGRTNREIARALFLSLRTVEMHVGDILMRLDSHTRTEAVYKAGQLSLLKTP